MLSRAKSISCAKLDHQYYYSFLLLQSNNNFKINESSAVNLRKNYFGTIFLELKPINYRNLSNLVYFKTTKTVQILSHPSTAKWPNIISLCVKSFTIRCHEVHCTLTNKSMNAENLKAIISLESKHLQTPCTQLFRDQNLRERLRTFVVAAGKWFITWNALTWNKKTTRNKISGSFSVWEKQFGFDLYAHLSWIFDRIIMVFRKSYVPLG